MLQQTPRIIGIALAIGLVSAPHVCAQSAPEPKDKPAFDVAVIKPNHTGGGNSGFRRAGPGMLNALNATLKMLIGFAYDLRDYQITGGPNWLDSEHFDILAKPAPGVDPDTMTPAERNARLRLRVQSLLADRFQLTLHRSEREMPIFAMVVAKNGPRLNESKDGSPELISNGHHLTCRKVTMASMAKIFLQNELRRFVRDDTGLQGEYDFTLDWASEDSQRRTSGDGKDEPVAGTDGPSLFTALQEQLGLKLEPQKGPVEILVVDRARTSLRELALTVLAVSRSL